MNEEAARKRKFARIILAYPFALIAISLAVNTLVFGIAPIVVAEPRLSLVAALAISAVLLLANHTWLMTSTELTRLKYNLHATPEEWEASDHDRNAVSAEAQQELERRHNAHANATENGVYFVLLSLLMCAVSPSPFVAELWFISFAVGRLGHSFSYLSGQDGLRGIFMSISLLSLYGMASYLVLGLLI